MPEGPEVKRIGEQLNSLEGKRVKRGLVVSGRYMRGAIHNLERLEGAKLERVSVKGKLIVFHMRDGEPFSVLSTMGMTGWWVVLDKADSEWDQYRRLELQFEDGTVAAFFDPRNFGTFKIVSYSEMKRKLAELGPDILTDPQLWAAITHPEFIARARRFGKNQTLAEALLDQRICSGCGNYIRADAMYLARLSPHRRMSELSDEELKRIWQAMHVIAVHAGRDEPPPVDFPGTKPVLARMGGDKFVNLVYSQPVSPTGGTIESFTDSNGRTVWWSPKEQA